MNTATGLHPVTLPPMGTMTPEQTASKSLTHWVMTLYRDINNMGPIEIKSQLGYRDQRWTVLKRCTPYPLGNLTSYEPDRQAAEEAFASSLALNSEYIPKVESVKYAKSQADELFESYRDSGLRILTPLTGMNDVERVNQIIQTVIPFAYSIHEMEYEFSVGATQRIANSNLSDEDKAKATQLAAILLNGATDPMGSARTKAQSEFDYLISSMSDKMAGGAGISNPSPFHEWICQQLDKPVPRRIDPTGGQSNNNDAINILAKRALKEESAAEAMSAQLEEERAARAALEAKVDALLAAQQPAQTTSAKTK